MHRDPPPRTSTVLIATVGHATGQVRRRSDTAQARLGAARPPLIARLLEVAHSSPPSAIVAGNVTLDCFHYVERLPRIDEVVPVMRTHMSRGGRGIVPAVVFALAGFTTSLATVVGESVRTELLDFLCDRQIDGNLVAWVEGEPPVGEYTALMGEHEQDYIAYVRPARVDWDTVGRLLVPSDVDVLYLSNNGGLFNHRLLESVDDKTLVVQNLGQRMRDQGPIQRDLILDRADVIVCNRVEVGLLDEDTGLKPFQVLQRAKRLQHFIVTQGSGDVQCYAADTGTMRTFRVEEIVDVRCPVGAGDSFAAAFAAARACAFELDDAMRLAMRIGAVAVMSTTSYVDASLALKIFQNEGFR